MEKIRLKQLRKLINESFSGSQTALSQATKISTSQIGQYLSGYRNIGEKAARKIEQGAGKPMGWLDQEDFLFEHRPIIVLGDGDPIPDGFVQIPEYKISFSAGNGTVLFEENHDAKPRTYDFDWFRERRINHLRVKRVKVKGDSMEPTLYDGDSIMINEEESGFDNIKDGKVYAIRYGNELRVKRLYTKLDGSLVLHSDNPVYRQEELSPEMVQEHITIIGRVRDKSGSGGL